MSQLVSHLADWVALYTEDRLESWICNTGDWKNLIDFYQKQDYAVLNWSFVMVSIVLFWGFSAHISLSINIICVCSVGIPQQYYKEKARKFEATVAQITESFDKRLAKLKKSKVA